MPRGSSRTNKKGPCHVSHAPVVCMQVRLEHLCSQALLGELVKAPSSASPAASATSGALAAPEAAQLDAEEEYAAAAASPGSGATGQAVVSPLSGLQVLSPPYIYV